VVLSHGYESFNYRFSAHALKARRFVTPFISVVQRRTDDIEFQKRTEPGSVIRHFLDVVIIMVAII